MDFKKKILAYLVIVASVIILGEGVIAQALLSDTTDANVIPIESNDSVLVWDFQFDEKKSDKKKKNSEKKEQQQQQQQQKDSDGDGVLDDDDLCPYVAGSKKAQGCPDKDDDGVPDFQDECPDTAGLKEFKGCPDSDGDGIPDNKDECPLEKGPASNKGCPIGKTNAIKVDEDSVVRNHVAEVRSIASRKDIFYEEPLLIEPTKTNSYYSELAKHLAHEAELAEAASKPIIATTQPTIDKLSTPVAENKIVVIDTDNDGVPDVEDKCPTVVGPKSNFGCPVVSNSKAWRVSQRDIILLNEETKLLDDIFNNLNFYKGRSMLDEKSYSLLDQFADLLNKKFSWVVTLHCYTNEGENAFRNQQLSSNRGDHIRTYLTSKGVSYSRIKVKPYGSSVSLSNTLTNWIEVEITR